jgi:hypothetical protein
LRNTVRNTGMGKQEQRVAGRDPSLVVGRQAAGGDDAVDMVMGQQVRAPGMQDGEKSDLGAEPFGIGGHFKQSLGAGLEEQIENRLGRSERQRVEFVGQGEDDMKVVGVEQVALLCLEP